MKHVFPAVLPLTQTPATIISSSSNELSIAIKVLHFVLTDELICWFGDRLAGLDGSVPFGDDVMDHKAKVDCLVRSVLFCSVRVVLVRFGDGAVGFLL